MREWVQRVKWVKWVKWVKGFKMSMQIHQMDRALQELMEMLTTRYRKPRRDLRWFKNPLRVLITALKFEI
jgi:hypothetical protein